MKKKMQKIIIKLILIIQILFHIKQLKSLSTSSYRKLSNCEISSSFQYFFSFSHVSETDKNLSLYECQKCSNCKFVLIKLGICYLIEQEYKYLKNSS